VRAVQASTILWVALCCGAPGLAWAQNNEAPPPAEEGTGGPTDNEAASPDNPSDAEGATPDNEATDAEPIARRTREDEVVVYSERLVYQARQELIEAAAEQGYIKEIRKGDRLILRHPATYHGEIVLHDNGLVEIKRQPVQFRPPFAKVTPASWLTCILFPLCIRANGQMVSGRKYRHYEREAWSGVGDEATQLNDRIADLATDRRLNELPDQLQALWDDGVPLDGGTGKVAYGEARRAALFAYWDSRTENLWGQQVRDAVVSFMRGVVQNSETPYTDAEVRRLNRGRQSAQVFTLQRTPVQEP